jgi:hypothetical protein
VHLRAGPLFGFAAGGGGAVVAIGKRTNQASDMRLHVEARGNQESQIEISAVVGVTILILWPTFVKSEHVEMVLSVYRRVLPGTLPGFPLADDLHNFRRMDVRLGPLERGFEFEQMLHSPETRERRPLLVRAHLRKLPERHFQAALTKLEPQCITRVPLLFHGL